MRSPRPSPSSKRSRSSPRAWEIVHNTIRPHQAFGYLTPTEYLASARVDVLRTYWTSTRDE